MFVVKQPKPRWGLRPLLRTWPALTLFLPWGRPPHDIRGEMIPVRTSTTRCPWWSDPREDVHHMMSVVKWNPWGRPPYDVRGEMKPVRTSTTRYPWWSGPREDVHHKMSVVKWSPWGRPPQDVRGEVIPVRTSTTRCPWWSEPHLHGLWVKSCLSSRRHRAQFSEWTLLWGLMGVITGHFRQPKIAVCNLFFFVLISLQFLCMILRKRAQIFFSSQ